MKPQIMLGVLAILGVIAGAILAGFGRAVPEYIPTATIAALSALAGAAIPRKDSDASP